MIGRKKITRETLATETYRDVQLTCFRYHYAYVVPSTGYPYSFPMVERQGGVPVPTSSITARGALKDARRWVRRNYTRKGEPR